MAGETYLLLDRSLQSLVNQLAQPLAGNVQLDWPVHKISYGQDGATLHGPHGKRKRCRKVLVTASLAVLQAGIIAFEPPLPQAKAGALSRLRMTNAIKVITTCSSLSRQEGCCIPEQRRLASMLTA